MTELETGIKGSDILILDERIVLREEKFGGLVLFRGKDTLFVLNKIGYEILSLCREGVPIKVIVHHVRDKYRVEDKKAEGDVILFIKDALAKKMARLK